MPATNYYKLDNPAWFSLTEEHRHFAKGSDEIKCYDEVAPFAACLLNKKEIISGLDAWTVPGDSFFMMGEMPDVPANYIIESGLLCMQMICTAVTPVPVTATLEPLYAADDAQMVALINMVLPGYYKPGTRLMGDYYGIRCGEQLVAITGERMRMDGLTEISAVVTHPAFTGRKYAAQLIAHTANKNLEAGIIPFLHVAATNERAISLYKYLGFTERRTITFWKIKRVEDSVL